MENTLLPPAGHLDFHREWPATVFYGSSSGRGSMLTLWPRVRDISTRLCSLAFKTIFKSQCPPLAPSVSLRNQIEGLHHGVSATCAILGPISGNCSWTESPIQNSHSPQPPWGEDMPLRNTKQCHVLRAGVPSSLHLLTR